MIYCAIGMPVVRCEAAVLSMQDFILPHYLNVLAAYGQLTYAWARGWPHRILYIYSARKRAAAALLTTARLLYCTFCTFLLGCGADLARFLPLARFCSRRVRTVVVVVVVWTTPRQTWSRRSEKERILLPFAAARVAPSGIFIQLE